MKVQRMISTKLDCGDTFTATIEFDYSGIDQQTILGWATSNRTIAFQRVIRKLSLSECKALVQNGMITLHASTAGHKIESEVEKVNRLVGMGIPKAVAELAIRNPSALASITSEIDNDDKSE